MADSDIILSNLYLLKGSNIRNAYLTSVMGGSWLLTIWF